MKKDFNEIIEEHRKYYKSIVSVSCPILQDTVYFTSEGFNHLLYKTHGRPRKKSEIYMKLMCLKNAPEVIAKCTTVSKTRKIIKFVKNKEKESVCHELVCKIRKGKEIRVVVGQVGTGKLKFLSVMPHSNKSKPKTKKRQKRRS